MRKVIILLIIPTLFVLGMIEYSYINTTFKNLNNRIDHVQQDITNLEKAEGLKNYWKKHENYLTYISKHASINDVTIRLIELTDYIRNNDTEKAEQTLQLLKYLVSTANKNVGFNLHNII